MKFGEGTNFTVNRSKCGIATDRSVQIKVETLWLVLKLM